MLSALSNINVLLFSRIMLVACAIFIGDVERNLNLSKVANNPGQLRCLLSNPGSLAGLCLFRGGQFYTSNSVVFRLRKAAS